MDQKILDKQMRYKKTKIILGEGSFKTVTKAIDEEEGKDVAYNEVRIKNYENETKAETSFSKEIALLKTINHPNIIKIVDYWFSEDNFIFITEFMTGGSLSDYIEKNGPLSTKLIRKWGRQILQGMVYLHSQNPPIIHRDIKSDNIFVNTAIGEVKIGDLGLARERRNKRYTIVGTPHFMAREMFEGEGYTEKVDIYAFGMCLIEMATGIRPYNEFDDTKDIYKSVLQGIFPKALKSITEPCLKSLIISCLVPSAYRFTSSQCLDHHFFHPEVSCTGECVPQECVAVYPLSFENIKNMELSIVSIIGDTITFQILLYKTMKFIKFEFDLKVDTVENVSEELMSESIIDKGDIENFSQLLSAGLLTVETKLTKGKAHDGIIELNSLETSNIKNKDMVISNFRATDTVTFGKATLEEMSLIEEKMKIQAAKMEIEKNKENETTFRLKSKLLKKDASYEPVILKGCEQDGCSIHEQGFPISPYDRELTQIEEKDFDSTHISDQFDETPNNSIPHNSILHNSIPHIRDQFPQVNDMSSGSTSPNQFNQITDMPSSSNSLNIRDQFPQVNDMPSGSTSPNQLNQISDMSSSPCSTSSIPQQLEETLHKMESVTISDLSTSKSSLIEFPLKSPPFSSEELAVNNLSLSGSYQRAKVKYKSNSPITQFAVECAMITGRTEEAAKSWIKALKEEHIETVFDLKLMVYEDWEKLPLTVFASRAMQNMIYGIDGSPLKEKQLPLNHNIREYENPMTIREFLTEICSLIGRSELISNWCDRLLAEDIQTVGELKSLHQDDWNRLGLSVYGHRILKNTIQRKGKITNDS